MKTPDLGTHDNPVVDERRSCKEARDAKDGWRRSSGRVDASMEYAPVAIDTSAVSTTAGASAVVDASVTFADAAGIEGDEFAGTTTGSSEPGTSFVVLIP